MSDMKDDGTLFVGSNLSLRDYFAIQVMDRAILMSKSGDKVDHEYNLKLAAQIAYVMADAMLKERSKP